jgi:hypothetical protein
VFDTIGKGEEVEKGLRVNMVQIPCTHINREKIPFETISPTEEGGIIQNGGGGEFKYDAFDIV